MRDYAQVTPNFWFGPTGKKLRASGPHTQLVALYLLTCPSANMLGMYYLPIINIAHECGLSLEGATEGLQRAIEVGFCSYDDDAEMVWVYEMAHYQIASALKPTDNRCAGVQREYDNQPQSKHLRGFYEKYQAAFHMKKARGNKARQEAPCKPLPSQEQKQEQEQEQKLENPLVGQNQPDHQARKILEYSQTTADPAKFQQGVSPTGLVNHTQENRSQADVYEGQMSHYRKSEACAPSDKGFHELSALSPCGRELWFFLQTGPHTKQIPGLFRAGRASMADELNWEPEAFAEAFQEIFDRGMAKADFKAKLVWLPNALAHNKPESPNVIRDWHDELDLLPECDLKCEAIRAMRQILSGLGSSYEDAFDELFSAQDKAKQKDAEKSMPKPSGKPSAKTMANQEQEQEQEQEQQQENNLVGQEQPDQTAHQIFEFWPKAMDSQKSTLESIRERLTKSTLTNNPPADVCTAILGRSTTPHSIGGNDRDTKLNSLNAPQRDAEKIDYFRNLDCVQARSAMPETVANANIRIMRELDAMTSADGIDAKARIIDSEGTQRRGTQAGTHGIPIAPAL